MKAQPGDYEDWEKLFGLDVQNVVARFGCQCLKCKRAEVELRNKEHAEVIDG